MARIHESGENYLENILILEEKQGNVRSVDLARKMGFSKPSVSRAVHLLEDEGFIVINQNGYIILTEEGRSLASQILEKHLFLMDYFLSLGVSEETAAEDACRIEHVISEETFLHLKKHVLHCQTHCSHAGIDGIFKYNLKQLNLENCTYCTNETCKD